MYKYRSKQISLTDFNTPVGMKLNPDNRWVKKAELIPWDEIEQRYFADILDRIKRIKIIYNCIGDFQTPPTEHEKSA